jgi:cytochrome c-type biogenesis protein
LDTLSLVRLTGSGAREQVSLNDLAGKVVLINVWGTWCPPCIQELPHIADIQQQFEAREDAAILPISYGREGLVSNDEQLEELRSTTSEFLEQRELSLTTYGDLPGETYRSLQATLGRVNFPTNVMLDRDGVIRAVWEGYAPGMEREVERELRKLLDES